jgi:hypothetical protein
MCAFLPEQGGAMTQTPVAQPALQLGRGDHVCVFCRGSDERDQLLVPFLSDGLQAGHKCLAVLDTSQPAVVLDALGPAAVAGGAADQLSVLTSTDVYAGEHGFDMEGMLSFYAAELRAAAAGTAGYDCIRTAGEMSWALRDLPGVGDLLAYEARVNQVLGAHPDAAISLCMYDVDRFDGEVIVGVLRTHPKLVMSGTVIDNPFFIDPQTFLSQRN